jgi:methionyl aminopeptidase
MHQAIRAAAGPGVTTLQLDGVARDVLAARGATSNFLGYHGYPAVICASVNDELVHGIPNGRLLQDGDIVSIDCGAIVNGWHGDAAFTMGIGAIGADAQRLIDTADRALVAAVAAMRPGGTLGDVGAAVEAVVAAAGYGSPHDYCGHGIGRAMHEEPDVENRGRRGKGPRLEPGVVLAIEPMLIAGGHDDVLVLDDDWTVVTADGSLAAHTEHTVVVTDRGPEILTRL